ncbi:hypothetical protein G5V59_14625 [Nocardioides sp. W3-2-3]|nr:hypothetical protein [Nocardioides convexus]
MQFDAVSDLRGGIWSEAEPVRHLGPGRRAGAPQRGRGGDQRGACCAARRRRSSSGSSPRWPRSRCTWCTPLGTSPGRSRPSGSSGCARARRRPTSSTWTGCATCRTSRSGRPRTRAWSTRGGAPTWSRATSTC